MSGTGSTVVLSGASGSLTGGGYLAGRELVNEGTTTLGSGMVNMSEGAQIRNSGVLKTDPAYSWDGFRCLRRGAPRRFLTRARSKSPRAAGKRGVGGEL